MKEEIKKQQKTIENLQKEVIKLNEYAKQQTDHTMLYITLKKREIERQQKTIENLQKIIKKWTQGERRN